MYRCGFCNKVSKPRASCNKVVVATRMHHHPFRQKVQQRWVLDKNGKRKLEWCDDPGGVGPQIAHEVDACADCAKEREN